MPKIKLISLAINLEKINFFYFSKLNKYQKEIFKNLGLTERKIITPTNIDMFNQIR